MQTQSLMKISILPALLLSAALCICNTPLYSQNQTTFNAQTLFEATQAADTALLKELIAKGINPNETDSAYQQNALHYASWISAKDSTKAFRVVQLLVDAGVPLNSFNYLGQTPFCHAVGENNNAIAKVLLKFGADIHAVGSNLISPLMAAAKSGNLEMAAFLIGKGSNANTLNMFRESCLLNALISNTYKTLEQQTEMVRLLVSKMDNVNIGHTDIPMLHYAISKNKTEIAKILIEAGIDINQTDKNGWNALHHACYYKNLQIAQILLSKGIDVNAVTNSGYNALLIVVVRNYPDSVMLPFVNLLVKEFHSNPAYETIKGKSPLAVAMNKNRLAISELMLSEKYEKKQLTQAATGVYTIVDFSMYNGKYPLSEKFYKKYCKKNIKKNYDSNEFNRKIDEEMEK